MRSCASRIYRDRSSHYFTPNSANQATLNLLELLLVVFEMEDRVHQPDGNRYRPFKQSLLEDKDFVQKVLYNVDVSLPSSIQIVSIEVMRKLFGHSNEFLHILDKDVQSSLLRALNLIYVNSINL